MSWDYKREESTPKATPLPEGNYRIRVKSAEKAVSKNSGNDMIALQFEVSGSNRLLFHYITFLVDKPEITNRMLTAFFDSFKDIEDGNFDMNSWVGKIGACHVKHEEYNGDIKERLSYFIKADKQDSLPPWSEPSNSGGTDFVSVPKGAEGEDSLPFF